MIVSLLSKANKQDGLIILGFFIVAILSRFFFLEQMQSHWDGPQYSIAIISYSLLDNTPAPPGYPLYIGLGKIFNLIMNNPHGSLLAINLLTSAIGVSAIYLTGKIIFNRSIGIIASVLFLTGPTFYFFGLTAYAYSGIPLFASLFFLTSYFIIVGKYNIGIILGALTGLWIGFRIQDAYLIAPLFLLNLFFLKNKERAFALISLFFISWMWFWPLINSVGGIDEYFSVLSMYMKEGALIVPSISHSLQLLPALTKGMFLSFTIGLIFLLYYPVKLFKNGVVSNMFNSKVLLILSFLIVPSLVFNLILRSDHAGHQMIYLTGTIFLIAYAVFKSLEKSKIRLIIIVIFIVLFNLFTFFRDRDPEFNTSYTPTSFHYSEIRKNDIKLGSKVDFVMRNFDKNKTIIILGRADLWRPVMYHLPEYKVIQIDALVTKDQRYKNIRRDGYRNRGSQYLVDNWELEIPEEITYVVFLDDQATSWIKDYDPKRITLPGKSSITVLDIKTKSTLKYGFGSIFINR